MNCFENWCFSLPPTDATAESYNPAQSANTASANEFSINDIQSILQIPISSSFPISTSHSPSPPSIFSEVVGTPGGFSHQTTTLISQNIRPLQPHMLACPCEFHSPCINESLHPFYRKTFWLPHCIKGPLEYYPLMYTYRPQLYASNSPSGGYPLTYIDDSIINSDKMKFPVEEIPPVQPLVPSGTLTDLTVIKSPQDISKIEDMEIPVSPRTNIPTKCFSYGSKEHDLFKCDYPGCTRTFTRQNTLRTHTKSHSDIRPYRCQLCARSFSRKHDLHRHIRVHTGEKPYSCRVCRKSFARGDGLKRHYKVENNCKAMLENL